MHVHINQYYCIRWLLLTIEHLDMQGALRLVRHVKAKGVDLT